MSNPSTNWSINPNSADAATELEAHVLCGLSGQLRNFRIDVRAEGLLLQGHAQTYHVKQLAEDKVRQLTGQRILANEIEVF